MDTEYRNKILALQTLDRVRALVRVSRTIDAGNWTFDKTANFVEKTLEEFKRRTAFDVFKYVRPSVFLRELTRDLNASLRVSTAEFYQLLNGVASGNFRRSIVFSDNSDYNRLNYVPYFIAVNAENTVVTILAFPELYDVPKRRPKLDLLLKFATFAGQSSPLDAAAIVDFLDKNAFEDTKIAVRFYGDFRRTKSANRCRESVYNDVATAYSGGGRIIAEIDREARNGIEREHAPTLNFEDGSTRSQRIAASIEAAMEEGFSAPYYLASLDCYGSTIDYRVKPIKTLPKEERYHDYL